jgi:hypothetical protein
MIIKSLNKQMSELYHKEHTYENRFMPCSSGTKYLICQVHQGRHVICKFNVLEKCLKNLVSNNHKHF